MKTPNKQAELEREIEILENKYGLASTKELVKDYTSPIEKLIALQAELKGIKEGKALVLTDELRFLQWVKIMLLNINYEDGLNDREIKFEKRIEELKAKLQSPQVTSKQSPFETADTRKGKSKIAGKKK